MTQSESEFGSNARPQPVRMWLYLVVGTVVGIVAGIVEALVSSIGSTNFWWTVKLHYFQLGFAGWFFGLVGGYVVAKRMQRARLRRWQERTRHGQCVACGYDLRGNTSGHCPECGQPAHTEAVSYAQRGDSSRAN